MHATACLAGQEDVDVEVGEDCRTLQALKDSIVKALPQLCVEGFDVSVGGRALDDDEGVVALSEDVSLDVSANSRVLSVLALREAGREVSEAGLLQVAAEGDVALCTLYLDAGVPIDCVGTRGLTQYQTPLFASCRYGSLEIATLLLDRGSTAIDEKSRDGQTPLFASCQNGYLEIATLLLDRGSTALDEQCSGGQTPLSTSCCQGHSELATLLLERGSTALDEKDRGGQTPLFSSCWNGHLEIATLLLDRGSTAIDEKDGRDWTPLFASCCEGHAELATLLLDRGSTALDEKNRDGQTPLFSSCCNGHLELATLLLDRGSTAIDEKGSAGSRPLVPALSPMGWRAVLRSGRVHKPWPRLRSSGSRHARHRSHIRQLRRARTIRHGSGRASGRANWYGGGSGRPRPTGRAHTRPRRVRGYR